MADIFLSYKREDVDQARRLAAILEDWGWTVFWDPEILSGEVWDAVLQRELAQASCVVVLWSRQSVGSEWVIREARDGSARDVLLPVLIERVEPPEPFRHLHATDLAGWHGETSGSAIDSLRQAIDELIGRRLLPLDMNLITGDRERWAELGPTVNMGCRLTNIGRRPLAMNRLELVVYRESEPLYELAWHLFYSASGLEHVKNPHEGRITVAGKSTWERGVQFRNTQADLPNVWPSGPYEFDLLAWVNCRPLDSRANVRTRFRADVDPRTSSEMARWRGASVEEWTNRQASDRALGFPIRVIDVRVNTARRS